MTNLTLVEDLLGRVAATRRKQEEALLQSGGNFNIFSILGLETREVGTHSAFLGELLNPRGSHGLGDVFLRLFLPLVELEKLVTNRANLVVERYIGPIDANYEQGGRIDIYLEAAGKYLFIENKIYATDQRKQLLRYHRFRPQAKLVYLTLGGETPTDWSTGGLLTSEQYVCLSYRQHIRGWLEKCLLAADAIPVVRETIAQYLKLVTKLTGGAPDNLMKQEVREMLLQSPDSFEAAAYIAGLVPELKQELTGELWQELNAAWTEAFQPDTFLLPGYVIRFEVMDDDRLKKKYFGFRAYRNDQPVRIDSTTDLQPALKLMGELRPPFKPEWDWLGWCFVERYPASFDQLTPRKLLNLKKDAEQRHKMIADIIRVTNNW